MKYLPAILMSVLFASTVPAWAQRYDLLARQQVAVPGADPQRTFLTTADDPRGIFERYQPKMDGGSTLVAPLKISGSRQTPRLQMSIRKCVAIVCKTVDLDAQVSVREVNGVCERDFVMELDLSRSGQMLTDVYDRFEVQICYGSGNGNARLDLTARARQAASYDSGIVQNEIFKLLQVQTPAIKTAIEASLRAHQ